MGFGHQRPQAKQQGPGSQGQPCTALPSGDRIPGAKTVCVAFLSRGVLGLLLTARGDFPFDQCNCQKLVLGCRCDGASALSGRSGSGIMSGAYAQKAFACPILLPRQGEPVGSGFRETETPTKAAGPIEPGAAPPRFALWRAEGQGRKRLALLS